VLDIHFPHRLKSAKPLVVAWHVPEPQRRAWRAEVTVHRAAVVEAASRRFFPTGQARDAANKAVRRRLYGP
jgi:hypothetical protein